MDYASGLNLAALVLIILIPGWDSRNEQTVSVKYLFIYPLFKVIYFFPAYYQIIFINGGRLLLKP